MTYDRWLSHEISMKIPSNYYYIVDLESNNCFHQIDDSFFCLQRHRRSPHIWYHLLPTFLGLLAQANSQCFGGVETYEKTSGTTVMCDNASECNIRGLVTQEDTSVTRDCIAICKQSSACTTFTVGKYIIIVSILWPP